MSRWPIFFPSRCLPLLAAGRRLSRHEPKPGRKVAAPFELLHRRREGLDGQGADRTHTRHRLQAAGEVACKQTRASPI
jgi:hypothetical protein